MDTTKPAAPITQSVSENKSKNYLPIIILVIIVLVFCACIAGVITLLALANNNRDTNLNVSPTPVETTDTPTPITTKAPEPTLDAMYKEDKCNNINSRVILPKEWYIAEDNDFFAEDTGSCYLTKQEITSTNSQFSTGLTIIKFFEVEATVDTTPSLFVYNYLGNVKASEQVIDSSSIANVEGAPGDIIAKYIYVDTLTTRQYHGVYANDSTDTLFIILFEAPFEEFNNDFEEFGREMIEKVELNF